MQTIEKDNEVYQEFEENKQKELREFEKVQYFSVAQEIEEDPNLKKIEKLEDGEDD